MELLKGETIVVIDTLGTGKSPDTIVVIDTLGTGKSPDSWFGRDCSLPMERSPPARL